MKLVASKILQVQLKSICVAGLLLGSYNAYAAAYIYPIPGFSVPLSLSDGDTVTVNSGTIATASGNSTSYTINFSDATTNGVTITNDIGATIGYNGTNGAGAAISSTRTTTTAVTNTITNNGTIDSGPGLYALYFNNATSGIAADNYTITNTGTINGAILSSGVNNITLNLNGSNAKVVGTITMGTDSSGLSILNVQSGANFVPTEQLSNIGLIQVFTGSSMTFNVLNTNIKALTVDSGGVVNINYDLRGLTTSDGNITNNGTMNIAADIFKTGAFTGSGTNIVSDELTITTNSYAVANHTALMTDVSMYSKLNLTTASFTSSNFAVTYDGGYLDAGTYTLVTAPGMTTPTFTSIPPSTLFLTFNPPTRVNNTIQMVVNRNPFNSFATNTMTQNIGANLEVIGSGNPTEDMVALLNAIEASTTPGATQGALQQLAPLSTAPLYGFEIQDTTMYQVELRLASLRDQNHYYAGDIARDNHVWVRPFGTYANQKAKYDILGYYGSSGGVTIGFDRNLGDNYLVGASGGYVLSHIDDKINTQSTTKVQSYLGMIYGTYDTSETSYLDWIFAIVANEFDASRFIDINNYEQTATSSYSSQQFSVKGLWSKDYSAFDFMQLTPQASAQYTYAKQYSYSESGANGANLDISRTNSSVVQLALGGKVAVPLWLNPSIFIPELHATVFYNPVIGEQNTIFSFIEGGGQTTSFFNLNRTGLVYGGALTVAVVDKLEVKLNLDIDVQDRFSGYTAYLNLRYLL